MITDARQCLFRITLSSQNREEVLRVLDETLSEELFVKWLDSIKAYDYLESELAELPSRFAEVYLP